MNKLEIYKEIFSWIKTIGFAMLFAYIINTSIIVNSQVISPSMENTLMTNDKIFGLRHAYLFNDPARYDIVIFKFPDDETAIPYLKRIIGLPNEKIQIIDGKVYVNDSTTPLEDSFVESTPTGNYGPFYVPENAYFLLGDNRNNSWDSKNWTNTFVYRDKIIAKLYLRWSPTIDWINDSFSSK